MCAFKAAVSLHHLRLVFAAALALGCAASAYAAANTVSDRAARDRAIEKQLEDEANAAEQASENFRAVDQKLRADNKAALEKARDAAEAFKNAHGERGLSPVVIEHSAAVFNDATQSYDFSFHFDIEYRDKLGEPQKIAKFDQDGNLISFENTPYGNANAAVSAHTPRGLVDKGAEWSYARDAEGNEYPTFVRVVGRENEDSPSRTRLKLWFNEDGIPYKGETFGADGKRNGGFVGKDDMAPKAGDPKGELADVPVPRIVTQPCAKCRDLAEQRNAIAQEATALARMLNETAAEQRRMHRAALSVGRPSQASTALRLKYETNLPRYQQLMDQLADAHSAFLDCQKTCVPPKQAMSMGAPVPTAPANDPEVSLAPSLFFGDWRGPQFTYLGFENGLAVQTFRVEGLKRSDDFTGFDLHAAATLSKAGAFHFGFNTYDVSFDFQRDELDPLGQRLLFPGVTTPGFFLNPFVPEGTPGGLNVVENLRYAFNQENTTLYGAYAHGCEHGDFTLIGYGGLALSRTHQRQMLTGAVPGFALAFDYDTRFDVDAVRATLGVRTVYGVPQVPRLSLYAGATVFANFLDAEGRDSLQLGGTFQELDIGKSETTFSWSLGLGGEYKLSETFTLFGEARYFDDDVTPIAVREDDGASHAEFARSKSFTGRFGGRLSF